MQRPHDPTHLRRKIFLVFLLGIVCPAFALAWYGFRAIETDVIVLQRLLDERHRAIAKRAVNAIARETLRREAEAAAAIRPEVFRDTSIEGLRALAAELAEARREHPIVDAYFLIAPGNEILLPDALAPWRSEPREEGANGGGRLDYALDPRLGDAESDEGLKEAIRLFEQRKDLERRYRQAQDLEFARRDIEGAIAIYRELALAPREAAVRDQALLNLARCYVKVEDPRKALVVYEELATGPPARRADNGLPIAPAALLQRAKVHAALGEPAAAAEVLLTLREGLLRGEFGLSRSEYGYFSARAASEVEPLLPDAAASARERCDALSEREAEVDRRAAFREDFKATLLPRLRRAFENPLLQSEEFSNLQLQAPPRLAYYRYIPEDATGVRPLVFGFTVDLQALSREVIAPAVEQVGREAAADLVGGAAGVPAGVDLAVVDAENRTVARAGDCREHRFALAEPFDEVLPLYKVRVFHRGESPVSVLAQRRTVQHLGVIGTAVVAIVFGMGFTLRAVSRSLELAKLKHDFVSAVSHELRTPLTSIRMFADMLKLGRVRSDAKRQEYVESIAAESERLSKLIDNILDFAKMEDGRRAFDLAPRDPGEVVARTVEVFKFHVANQGFTLDCKVEEGLPRVDLDADALEGALLNLLSNAMKYSSDRKEIAVRARREGEFVAIDVSDKGVGIAEEDRPRIFEKFFRGGDEMTREVPGSGLGLAIVRHVVRAHRGEVTFRSRVGEGTTFTVRLPVSRGGAADGAKEGERA